MGFIRLLMANRSLLLKCTKVLHNCVERCPVWKEGTEIPGGGERVEIAWPLFMQMTLFFALSQRRA